MEKRFLGDMKMRIAILGGGLAGVSLASFLQDCQHIEAIEVFEKEVAPGGLCRSYPFAGLHYNVGPHIMFSKNAEVLDLMSRLFGENVHQLRRSNQDLPRRPIRQVPLRERAVGPFRRRPRPLPGNLPR